MKKFFVCLFLACLVVLIAQPAWAAGHTVVLTWTPSIDGAANPTSGYNAYKGTAPGSESSTSLNTSPITPGCTNNTNCTYTDGSVTAGQTYYYVVTFKVGSLESAKSNEALAAVPVAPASGLTATAN